MALLRQRYDRQPGGATRRLFVLAERSDAEGRWLAPAWSATPRFGGRARPRLVGANWRRWSSKSPVQMGSLRWRAWLSASRRRTREDVFWSRAGRQRGQAFPKGRRRRLAPLPALRQAGDWRNLVLALSRMMILVGAASTDLTKPNSKCPARCQLAEPHLGFDHFHGAIQVRIAIVKLEVSATGASEAPTLVGGIGHRHQGCLAERRYGVRQRSRPGRRSR